MKRRHQRLFVIAVAGATLALAMTLAAFGLRDQIVFFVSPSGFNTQKFAGKMVRVGGLVVPGSIRQGADETTFAVTDGRRSLNVAYHGVLPDLFRAGQGVVIEGICRPGAVFSADRVLAKHDERYMPPEVAAALKERGEWRGSAPSAGGT